MGLRSHLKNLFGGKKRSKATSKREFDHHLLPGLLGKNDPVILEVGCNDGTDTLKFLELFSEASIYTFEPDPRAWQHFQEKVVSSRVRSFNVAVSDENGETELHMSSGYPSDPGWKEKLPEGWDLSSSIQSPRKHLEKHPWCKFEKSVTVKTQTLDSWYSEQSNLGIIDFIWADIQGAEARMIRGAEDVLKKTCYLFTEYSDEELYEGQVDLNTLKSILPDFEVVEVYPGDVLLKNTSL
ncbi:MAG: FkbM family methyltransferase [Endozoicomonas sp.]